MCPCLVHLVGWRLAPLARATVSEVAVGLGAPLQILDSFFAELTASDVFLRIYLQRFVFPYICGRHFVTVEAYR